MWRKFTFFCLNITGNEKLCEHDMFALLEQFKLRDYIYFYRELYSKPHISSHYREAIDETDQPFFDAYVQDYGIIAKAFNAKRARL